LKAEIPKPFFMQSSYLIRQIHYYRFLWIFLRLFPPIADYYATKSRIVKMAAGQGNKFKKFSSAEIIG
jgi:hypothetical protein